MEVKEEGEGGKQKTLFFLEVTNCQDFLMCVLMVSFFLPTHFLLQKCKQTFYFGQHSIPLLNTLIA